MRYLIASLQSYETGHGRGDALCSVPKEAESSFMGDHLRVEPVNTEEFRLVTSNLLKAIDQLKVAGVANSSNHISDGGLPRGDPIILVPGMFTQVQPYSQAQSVACFEFLFGLFNINFFIATIGSFTVPFYLPFFTPFSGLPIFPPGWVEPP
jgi:hypothetical protein